MRFQQDDYRARSPSMQEIENIAVGLVAVPPRSGGEMYLHKDTEEYFIAVNRALMNVDLLFTEIQSPDCAEEVSQSEIVLWRP